MEHSEAVTESCQCAYGVEASSSGNFLSYKQDFSGIAFTYCPMCGKKLEWENEMGR